MHTSVHAKLTRNPPGCLTLAEKHGAAGTSSPETKEGHMNDRGRHLGDAPRRRTAAAIVAMAVTGLLAAACGGGGSHPSEPGANSGQSLAVVLDSYASCIRSHGIPDFYFTHLTGPPSAPPPGGVAIGFHGWFAEADSAAQFQSAQKACQHLLPFGNAQGTETHQEFLSALKSASCMRSHGYPNWPDPNPNVLYVSLPAGVDTNSTQFRAAAKTCGVPVPPSG